MSFGSSTAPPGQGVPEGAARRRRRWAERRSLGSPAVWIAQGQAMAGWMTGPAGVPRARTDPAGATRPHESVWSTGPGRIKEGNVSNGRIDRSVDGQ